VKSKGVLHGLTRDLAVSACRRSRGGLPEDYEGERLSEGEPVGTALSCDVRCVRRGEQGTTTESESSVPASDTVNWKSYVLRTAGGGGGQSGASQHLSTVQQRCNRQCRGPGKAPDACRGRVGTCRQPPTAI